MTKAQEAAIARVCAHECMQRELLEALQAITNQLERIGDTRPHKDGKFIDMARDVIDRAKGQA